MALQIGEPLSNTVEVRLELFFDRWKEKKLIHTASLRTYKLLAALCADSRGTIIDLGGGFPSVIMNEFNPNDCKHVSVSLTKMEMEKVTKFVDFEGEVLTWPEFKDKMYMDATLIFFNISDSTKRVNYFPAVFKKYLAHKGVKILFNDMHKPALFKGLQTALKGYEYTTYDILEETEDEHGRYCQLIEGI